MWQAPAVDCIVPAEQEDNSRAAILKALGGMDKAIAERLEKARSRAKADEGQALPALLEEFDELLDGGIGFLKRYVAVTEQLQTWYEINPDHPKAVALKNEWCGNLETGMAQVKGVSDFGTEHLKEIQKALEEDVSVESGPSLLVKWETFNTLTRNATSKTRQLTAMGLIPMKVVSDSDLIPVTRSDTMPVTIGAKRRWRDHSGRSDRHPSTGSQF